MVRYRNKCPAPGIEPGHGHPSQRCADREILSLYQSVDFDQRFTSASALVGSTFGPQPYSYMLTADQVRYCWYPAVRFLRFFFDILSFFVFTSSG